MPRTRTVKVPLPTGVQEYVQLAVPVAEDHVAPPSNDISTPATTPPTSVAVPEKLIGDNVVKVVPVAGEVNFVTGGVTSVDAVAAVSPA